MYKRYWGVKKKWCSGKSTGIDKNWKGIQPYQYQYRIGASWLILLLKILFYPAHVSQLLYFSDSEVHLKWFASEWPSSQIFKVDSVKPSWNKSKIWLYSGSKKKTVALCMSSDHRTSPLPGSVNNKCIFYCSNEVIYCTIYSITVVVGATSEK